MTSSKPASKKSAKKKTAPRKDSRKTSPVKKTVKKKIAAKKTTAKKTTVKKTAKKKPSPVKTKVEKTSKKKAPAKRVVKKKSSVTKKGSLPSPYRKKKGITPKYNFKTDLPEQYHKTCLRAIPRDPSWIFLYWEITNEALDTIKDSIGDETFNATKPILRVSDITGIDYNGGNALSFFDIEINRYADNWYIKVPHPGRTYVVENGLYTIDGTFFIIVRSNPVQVPQDSISERIDEEWKTGHAEEVIRYSNPTVSSPPGASENVLQSPLFPGAGDNNFIKGNRSK